MRKILNSIIFVLIVCKLNAQISLPQDSTSYCFFPVHESVLGKIVSFEHPSLDKDFQIEAKCYFLDTTTIYNLIWQLPANFSIINLNAIPATGNPGDSLSLSFILSIPDTSSLPFYPQDIELEVYTSLQHSLDPSVLLAGKIYFTPYKTII